jgi:hypothetical protein
MTVEIVLYDCWNCFISSSQYWCDFDLIVVHSYLILCCLCWNDDGIWSKRSADVGFLVVQLTHVLGVKLFGSGKFRCLAIFNGWLLKFFYFFQYWCDFDLIVVHSYLILCCVKMMMGSGELYGLDIFTVWWFKSDGWLQGNRRRIVPIISLVL